jgi:hypothetical protein
MKIYGFCDSLIPNMPITSYNKEFKWWPCDLKETYNPHNNTYGPDDIIYKFNSNGFRCDNFNIKSEKRIIFLGCSHTNGIGLPVEHTWPYILLSYIKQTTGYEIPYWNLAHGGSGLDTQTRLYYHYGLKLKPQLIFAYFPEYRREIYNNNDRWLTAFNSSHPENNFDNISYLIDPRVIHYETEKNMCFLDTMIKLTNSKMIHNHWSIGGHSDPIYDNFQIKHNINLDFDHKARDKIHAGFESHTKFAKTIFETYKDTIIETLKD